MSDWHIVERDGNPLEAGEYMTVLIFHEVKNWKETKRKLAIVESRFFINAEDAFEGTIMDGQPDEGLVWVMQEGSLYNEKVYAWREIPDDLPELPDGVEMIYE